MFEQTNDPFEIKEEEGLASVLLMDLIKSPSQEKFVQSTSLEEQNKKVTGSTVEEFLTNHETAIQTVEVCQENAISSLDLIDELIETHESNKRMRLAWWQKWIARKSVGIEINPRGIRAAQIRTIGERCELMRVEEIRFAEGKSDDPVVIGEYVKQLLRKMKTKSSHVVSLISGSDIHLRLLKMPKVSKKEIHDALLWKNKKELHFFNDAPTVLHYVILDEEPTPNEFYVIVIAVKEDVIKNHLEIMERAHLLPEMVTIRPVAQWNFFKALPHQGTSAVIDIGFDGTHLAFFKDESLQFARDIPVGGNHFTTALMQTIFVDNASYVLTWDEAESIKQNRGLLGGPAEGRTTQGIAYSEIAVLLRPVAEKLLSEIKMSIDYYKDNFKSEAMDNLYITGNAIRLKNLKTFLQDGLGRSVEVVRPGENIFARISLDSGRIFSCQDVIGAALSKGTEFNFLPQNLKTELRFKRAFSHAVSGVFLLIWTLGTLSFFLMKKNNDLNTVQSIVSESLARVQEQNREYDQLQFERSGLEAAALKITAETRSDSTMDAILKLISNITPEELVIDELTWGNGYSEIELRRAGTNQKIKATGVEVGKSEANPNQLRIKGTVYKDVFYADIHLLNFISAIEKSQLFKEVTLREKRRDETDDKLYFELVTEKR